MSFRYPPFEYMDQLMSQMDEMMTQMYQGDWDQTQTRPALGSGSGSESESGSKGDLANWYGSDLHMTLDQTEDGYTIVADVPGFEKDELELSFDEDKRTLRISGSHDEGDESSTYSRRIHEQTTIPGEGEVLVDGIGATYHNGVLEVHLPTETSPDEQSHTHRIDIDG